MLFGKKRLAKCFQQIPIRERITHLKITPSDYSCLSATNYIRLCGLSGHLSIMERTPVPPPFFCIVGRKMAVNTAIQLTLFGAVRALS